MQSSWIFGLVFVLAAIGFSILSVILARRLLSVERLRKHNDITGPIHATVGVVYAVILAFVVVLVWEQFNEAQRAVDLEAGALIALGHDVVTLSPVEGLRVHNALLGYTETVLTVEWPALESGDRSGHTTPEYYALWEALREVEADDRTERVWLETMIERMNAIDQWRSERYLTVESSVPTAMWILLLSGGFITIAFAALYGAEHKPTQIILVSALAALIAFTLFLIAAVDHPYSGTVRVEPEAFRHALVQIEGLEISAEVPVRENLTEEEEQQ